MACCCLESVLPRDWAAGFSHRMTSAMGGLLISDGWWAVLSLHLLASRGGFGAYCLGVLLV